jgi:hypothetical protein
MTHVAKPDAIKRAYLSESLHMEVLTGAPDIENLNEIVIYCVYFRS